MDTGKADVLRDAIEVLNGGGIEAALPYTLPDIKWRAPPEWMERRVYTGHQGLRELAADWEQNFDRYHLEVERLIDLGDDRVVALLRQRGQIRGSAASVEQAVAWVAVIRHGKLAHVDVYFSWEPALEAAGLSGQVGPAV